MASKPEQDIYKALKSYLEHFDEPFPILIAETSEGETLVDLIQKCIDKNELYDPPLDPDKIY